MDNLKYKLFQQEKSYWCVPACLQSILERRGFKVPSQKKIYSFFETNEEGIIFDKENLNIFLKNYDCFAEYAHPRTSFPEIDFVLKESLPKVGDILVTFLNKQKKGHCTLLLSFEKEIINLQDPAGKFRQMDFTELLKLMPFDNQCGFYLIY